MKKTGLIFLFFLLYLLSFGEIIKPVKWSISSKQLSDTKIEIVFEAIIDDPWHMYGLSIEPGGPIPTSLNYTTLENAQKTGDVLIHTESEKVFDKTFEMNVSWFSHKAKFSQNFTIDSQKPVIIAGYIEYQACDNKQCLSPEEENFSFSFNSVNTTENTPSDSINKYPDKNRSLFNIFLFAVLLGFVGIITPCVYPIIPLTVSFFMRGNKKRSAAITQALFFGISIIVLYTLLGLIIGLTKIDVPGMLARSTIANLIFFIVFFLFGLSFLGMFEIMLPAAMANKLDRRADKGGLLGPFFMALATVVISFSCTGPIMTLVLTRAAEGSVMQPVIGMFGFSLIFALPFTIFALLPGLLKSLPKSGGWLNAVKIFFAFILFGFSLKYLSSIDQSYHLNLLSRDVFLSIWITLSILLTLYLLGKIKFSHDSDLKYVSIGRFFFATASLSFAIFLITGLFGAPLKSLSSFLPPAQLKTEAVASCEKPKYGDILHVPYGLPGYFDYEQGLACAKKQNKPALIVFKGHQCSNCKVMEAAVWDKPEIQQQLTNNFIIIVLYTDDKTPLPEKEWVTSSLDGKIKKTIGKKYADFQMTKFSSNALPYHAIVDTEGDVLASIAYTKNTGEFKSFLNKGKSEFNLTKEADKPAVNLVFPSETIDITVPGE
jgi:thiol:disulfide interchange protein DsbD